MFKAHHISRPLYRYVIGSREIVGPSVSGKECYYDRIDQPCPPIRFKEPEEYYQALQEKEKNDWKSLTLDEKKELYRYNFCQTFKEMEAPNGEVRRVAGNTFLLLTIPILFWIFLKKTVFPPLPESMSDQNKKQLVRWYIDNHVDRISGISSKWDYEKGQWKERPYMLMRDK